MTIASPSERLLARPFAFWGVQKPGEIQCLSQAAAAALTLLRPLTNVMRLHCAPHLQALYQLADRQAFYSTSLTLFTSHSNARGFS